MKSTQRRFAIAVLAAAQLFIAASALADDDLTQPIRVSPDGHFLVQPDGSPFFLLADWGYELFKMPDRKAVERFLSDRSRKGFNVIFAPVTGLLGPLTRPNRYGELPFIDHDPVRPNPRYFENVDWIIERAAHYRLRIALLPSWGQPITGGFEKGPQPFNAENAELYGRWLAKRYQRKGILWVLGGDTNPLWPKEITKDQFGGELGSDQEISSRGIVDYTPVFDAFAKGILEGSGADAFITYHPTGASWAGTPQPRTSLYFGDRSWLDMNMIQSGHHLFPKQIVEAIPGLDFVWNASFSYEPISEEYHSKPTRPIIDSEPRFENEAINLNRENGYWKAYDVRNSAYQALFAGAAGVAYADVNTGMLQPELKVLLLDMTPEQALASPGSAQMQHAKALMLSRPYFTRIPDQSVIVGDAGRGVPHIGATRDREGSFAMIYLPHGQKVTVDLSKISGKAAIAWWFDPRTGQAARIDGAFPTSEARVFEPPSSGADTDWILVLDDKSRGFSPPGVTSSLASDAVQSGYVVAHDGTDLYYEVHGTGKKFLLFGHYMNPGTKDLQKYVEDLGDRYRLIVTDYPGARNKPEAAKMYTFTPATLARDHLAVLDAVGAKEFAYFGYSFDGASGLQLAIRTDRMKAFIAGGFPMMNGPYAEMLEVARAAVLDKAKSAHPPEISRQYLTYFEALQSFDDRAAQKKLHIPRLNFLGVQDKVSGVDFYAMFAASKREMETAGWDVMSLPGKDHVGAMAADVVVPLIRRWLDENWK